MERRSRRNKTERWKRSNKNSTKNSSMSKSCKNWPCQYPHIAVQTPSYYTKQLPGCEQCHPQRWSIICITSTTATCPKQCTSTLHRYTERHIETGHCSTPTTHGQWDQVECIQSPNCPVGNHTQSSCMHYRKHTIPPQTGNSRSMFQRMLQVWHAQTQWKRLPQRQRGQGEAGQ